MRIPMTWASVAISMSNDNTLPRYAFGNIFCSNEEENIHGMATPGALKKLAIRKIGKLGDQAVSNVNTANIPNASTMHR